MKKTLIAVGSVALVALIVAFSFMSSYNGLVSKEELVKNANSKIEVALQRRADLIPNVVESTKGYMKHEKEIFSNIADARSKIGSSDKATKEEGQSELSSAISRLLVVKESYPELKADTQVSALIAELEGTENRIGVARTDYNTIATEYNQDIRKFPKNILANMFGFKQVDLIKADEGAKTAPKVNLSE